MNKFLTVSALLIGLASFTGCYRTQEGRVKVGVPFALDYIESRYERPASQLFEAANKNAGVANGMAQADYAPLREWMTKHVHQHGRRFSRDELLVKATGRTMDPAPYIAHLTSKYSKIYGV